MATSRAVEHAVRRLISRASELKHRRMHELLAELGLHRGEPWVLYALWDRDGVTQSELSKQINRSPSTITKTVQRMEKAGLVARQPDDRDERVSRVFLTGAGREIRPAVERIWERLNQETLDGLDAEEIVMLHDLLLRVCRNLEARSR